MKSKVSLTVETNVLEWAKRNITNLSWFFEQKLLEAREKQESTKEYIVVCPECNAEFSRVLGKCPQCSWVVK